MGVGIGAEAAVTAVAFRVIVADGEIDGAAATLFGVFSATMLGETRVIVADGEIGGAAATLFGVFSATMLGETVAEPGIAEALGDT